MIAYCYQSGHIEFGKRLPEGAITLTQGTAKEVRHKILGAVRWSYPSKPGAGDEVMLVPGIPEADTLDKKLEALSKFIDWINKKTL